jgi:acyl carrier protein
MRTIELAQLLAETIPGSEPEDFPPERPFKEVSGWDSMARLSTIAAIDADFGLDVTGQELNQCVTVGQLHQLLLCKQTA